MARVTRLGVVISQVGRGGVLLFFSFFLSLLFLVSKLIKQERVADQGWSIMWRSKGEGGACLGKLHSVETRKRGVR